MRRSIMPISTRQDRDAEILRLWECAVGLSRWQRDDALLSAKAPPPPGLGGRNAALLSMRSGIFGRQWPLKSRCPNCGCDCEFEVDSIALVDDLGRLAPAEISRTIAWAGRSILLRAPRADDLQAISHHRDSRSAAIALVERCLSGELDISGMDDEELEEIGRSIEALDPAAVVTFQLRCPACEAEWSAAIDIGEAFWCELRHAAERSLIEVDALARAYGWTEDQVMGLSLMRRAAYLQLAGAT
jgi:hypothetical protein